MISRASHSQSYLIGLKATATTTWIYRLHSPKYGWHKLTPLPPEILMSSSHQLGGSRGSVAPGHTDIKFTPKGRVG